MFTKEERSGFKYWFAHWWECSRFTKEASPLTAREEMERKIKWNPDIKDILNTNMLPILNRLGL